MSGLEARRADATNLGDRDAKVGFGDKRDKIGDMGGHRGGQFRGVCGLPRADEPKIGCEQAQAALVRRYRPHPAVIKTDPERRHRVVRDTQAKK